MTIEERITEQLGRFSAGQRKVAEYILSDFEQCSYATLARLSKSIGVSETTIIRFAYSLGFESYSAMQSAIRQEILGQAPQENVETAQDHFAADVLARESQLLIKTIKSINFDDISEAVERLSKAEKVMAVASRGSYPVAMWFGTAADSIRENVSHINPIGDHFVSGVLGITEKTVVVCISFSRYSRDTYRFAQEAKARGAFLITVTDSKIAPIAEISDIVLLANSNRDETGINTFSSAAAVLNVLIVGMHRVDPKKAAARLSSKEQLYADMQAIFE